MKQSGKEWTNHEGKNVPTYAINPVLKTEEKHAQRIARAALKAEKALRELVELTNLGYEAVFNAKIEDAKFKGNKAPTGGTSINSFDHTIEVKITKPDNIYFDNTYTQLVKDKFDEFFNSIDSEVELVTFLREIVQDLLFTSGGHLDSSKVLQLRKYRETIQNQPKLKKKAQLFIDAVDLFDKAIKKKPGNPGIYVSIADGLGQKKRRIPLKYTDV